jgi:hypothetical protein
MLIRRMLHQDLHARRHFWAVPRFDAPESRTSLPTHDSCPARVAIT